MSAHSVPATPASVKPERTRTRDLILQFVQEVVDLQKVVAEGRVNPVRPTRRNPHRLPLTIAQQRLDTLAILADTPEAAAFAERIRPALEHDWRFDVP